MDNELEDRLAMAWLRQLGRREGWGSYWSRVMDKWQYQIADRYMGRNIKYESSVIVRMTNTR